MSDLRRTAGGLAACAPERVYVEVKSSSSSDKNAFEMSVQEVELARAEGPRCEWDVGEGPGRGTWARWPIPAYSDD